MRTITSKLLDKSSELAKENGGLSVTMLTKKFRLTRKEAKTIIGTLIFLGLIDNPFCKLVDGGGK